MDATTFSLNDKPPEGYGFIYKITSPSGKSYIGKTERSVAVRWIMHLSNKQEYRCPAIWNAIKKYGQENMAHSVLGVFLIKDLNDVERKSIVEHNTKFPHGYNLTDGGEGPQGAVRSQESRQKMSIAQKKRCSDPAVLKKMSDRTKKQFASKDARERLSRIVTLQWSKPESRKILSCAAKRSWENPAFRKMQSESSKARWLIPGFRENQAKSHLGRFPSVEARQNMSDAQKLRYAKKENTR